MPHVAKVHDAVPEYDGHAAEVSVAKGNDGGASMEPHGADPIVESVRKEGEAGASLHAKVVRRVVRFSKKARAVSRLVRGRAAGAGVPPARAVVSIGADPKRRAATAVDPNSLAVIAPGRTANAGRLAQLLDHLDI